MNMPMREYVCAPKNRSRRAYLYLLGCVLLATALWTVPVMWDVPYVPIWQFGSLFCLTVALLITARWLARRYVYRLVALDDGGFDFEVIEVRGKRPICVCRVGVEAFRAIAREEKRGRERPTYDWRVGMEGQAYLLTLADGEETVTVRFSPDKTLAAMIEYSLRSPL